LELGQVGGLLVVLLGIAMVIGSVVTAAKWFWKQARTHPQQPTQYPIAVNVGLLTILPTLALYGIAYYVTIDDSLKTASDKLGINGR
jgi:hypothetical protein